MIVNRYYTACEHLVGYSVTQPAIFKANQLAPVKDLKLLVWDYKVCGLETLPGIND